jgi:hypothetical protein
MKMNTRKFTVKDLQKAKECLRNQPLVMRMHPLYFTESQIKRFIEEGETVDLVDMKVNGYPFQYISTTIY